MTERTVAIVTGTRAEYGLLQSSMEAIQQTEALTLRVIATGMHLSPQHGRTIDDIRSDGFDVDRTVHMTLDGDSGLAMAKSLGIGTSGLAEAIADLDPEFVLLLGDRDEALAAGLAAVHMNIPVAHIHGGDSMVGFTIDDSIRHALTKLAHLHFPASEKSAERIRKLGEEEWRITTVGAPGLDAIRTGERTSGEAVLSKYGIDGSKPLALVVQHPVTTQVSAAEDQMRATLEALSEFDIGAIVIYPNSDAGGKGMISIIEEHASREKYTTFKSLPRQDFLGLMSAADVMVGNSSSGIIEAPSFGLPVVDVGPRQQGRERAENTISVPHDSEEIYNAIERCLSDQSFREQARNCVNPYDYGGAGTKVAHRLVAVELDDQLLQKRLTY